MEWNTKKLLRFSLSSFLVNETKTAESSSKLKIQNQFPFKILKISRLLDCFLRPACFPDAYCLYDIMFKISIKSKYSTEKPKQYFHWHTHRTTQMQSVSKTQKAFHLWSCQLSIWDEKTLISFWNDNIYRMSGNFRYFQFQWKIQSARGRSKFNGILYYPNYFHWSRVEEWNHSNREENQMTNSIHWKCLQIGIIFIFSKYQQRIPSNNVKHMSLWVV